jgi:hypothetical protein
VNRAGQHPGDPDQVARGAGDDLQFHAVPAVLSGEEGPVRGDPVGEDEGAVEDGVRVRPGGAHHLAQLRRAGGEQRDGLVHIPPGGRGPNPEPGREVGERLALVQVRQDQQGLPGGVQLPPQRADRRAVAADDPGYIGEGLARQRQRGTVEKHGSPW